MKIYVDLTDNELRALNECLSHSYFCCQSSCAYPEIQEKNIDCHNCKFTKGMASLKDKLSNMKTLADHDKQVRKEVCEEVREAVNECRREYYSDFLLGLPLQTEKHYRGYDFIQAGKLTKILDQIQGETK